MLVNRIFRERALRRRGRQEPLDDLLQVTAPHEWLILVGLAALLAALIAFVLFGRVDRAASFEAVLALPGERHYVAAPASGTVTEVLAEEGDTLAQGQPIAYVQTFGARSRELAIGEIMDTLEEKGQLTEGVREELLLTLLTTGRTTEPLVEIVSPGDGKLVSLNLAEGQPVSAGESVGFVREQSTAPPEVVAFVSPAEAARLQAGMKALVGVAGPVGSPDRVYQARVADVSRRGEDPPGWLLQPGQQLAQELQEPHEPHLLRVSLEEAWPDAPEDGSPVSLRVVLGGESLASLLAPGSGS